MHLDSKSSNVGLHKWECLGRTPGGVSRHLDDMSVAPSHSPWFVTEPDGVCFARIEFPSTLDHGGDVLLSCPYGGPPARTWLVLG